MSRQTDPVIEHKRRLWRAKYARKQAEKPARRIGLLADFYDLKTEAESALQDMDRADRELRELSSKTFIAILLMLCATMAHGQAILVISDTNQLKLLPSHIKVEWRTNLYTAVTDTFVTTNWMPVGQPVDIITNGVVILQRQYEAATLLTNVSHRLTYEGVERVWNVSQSLGPVLATRHYDFPPKLPFLAVPNTIPNRIQR